MLYTPGSALPIMRLQESDFQQEAQDRKDDPVASRLAELWTRDYLARPAILGILSALFVGYLGALLFLGPVPSTLFADDVFLLLDGGWRILNGLVPNHDFYLSMGPITYMWVAAGLRLAHGSAVGLTIGLLGFAALITVLAFLAARTRMTAAGTILYSAFVLLLCTAPMPIGRNPSLDLSYAMIYNRFGYGLLSILFVTLLLAPDEPRDRRGKGWLAGAAAGVSLALLFFLKVSYFGVGAGLVFLTLLVDLKNWRRFLPLAMGLGATTLAMLAYLRFDVPALVRDLWDTIHARGGNISHVGVTDFFDLGTTSLIALSLAVCFLGEDRARQRMILFGASLFTIVSEFFFARTNASQANTYPLYIVFIFILLAYLGQNIMRREVSAAFSASMIVVGLGLVAPAFYVHLRSLAFLAKYKTSVPLKAAAFHVEGDHLRSLAFYDYAPDEQNRQENGQFYTGYLNDGIDLLKKSSTSADVIASLSFHDPFPYALLRKPPRAGSTWFLLDNNISASHMPSNRRMFGDATVVMVPKHELNTHAQSDEFLFNYYKPYLLSNFTLAAESGQWSLYRRK